MSNASPAPPRYRFADHVRACHVGGQVILLDLRRGKYIGIGGPLSPAMACEIADWPAPYKVLEGIGPSAELEAHVDDLRQQEMLAPRSSPTVARASVDEPQQSLYACEQTQPASLQWRRMTRIAWATVVAALWLKRHSLADIAGRVSRMRPVPSATAAHPGSVQLQSAVAWYIRARPFVMTSHDACLRDSLTMVLFLAAERLYPSWVIGVRTGPFAAHSWVQAGDLVLNDLHETVRAYTPILVV